MEKRREECKYVYPRELKVILMMKDSLFKDDLMDVLYATYQLGYTHVILSR